MHLFADEAKISKSINSLKKHIEIIENFQGSVTKLVLSVFHLSYPDRLARLNLPTLSYGRARGDIIKVFKIT